MATQVVCTPVLKNCCAKCGTGTPPGSALLTNNGVKLCPAHWYEKYGPVAATIPIGTGAGCRAAT